MNTACDKRYQAGRCALLFAYLGCALWCAFANGSVNDEYAAHISGGYLYLATGRFAGGVDNPPLGQLWVALPQFCAGLDLFPFSDAPPILPRLANIGLGALFVLMFGRVVAKYATERGALLGTIALVACPDFLAHSTLATLDLPVTVALFGAVSSWILFVRRLRWQDASLFGLFLGAALSIKISAFSLFPVSVVLAVVTLFLHGGKGYARAGRAGILGLVLRGLCAAAAVAVIVIWGAYGFRSASTDALPGKFTLLPQEFIEQVVGKFRYATGGNEAFLLGKTRHGGWWWYYPVVLVVKTPLPLLLLWGVGIFHALRNRRSWGKLYAAAALVFLGTALFNRAQIGVRHLLPVVPLCAAAVALLATAKDLVFRRGAWLLAAGSLLSCVLVLPYPLTAESILLGGNGYLLLADSNYDWGQANEALSNVWQTGKAIHPTPYVPTTGTLAIRVNELVGFRSLARDGYAWLRGLKPTERVGGAGLVFEVGGAQLEKSVVRDAETTSLLCRAALRAHCGDTTTAEELLEEALARGVAPLDVFRVWLAVAEERQGLQEAYRVARRASLILPESGEFQNHAERLRLLIESEKLAERDPARSMFARANAALLGGNAKRCLYYAEKARELGAPTDVCLSLEYRAACELGWWHLARRMGARLPETSRALLTPPYALLVETKDGSSPSTATLALAGWCYARGAWKPCAELLAKTLSEQPDNKEAFNLLGELVVRYKEWSLRLSPSEKKSLERVALPYQ